MIRAPASAEEFINTSNQEIRAVASLVRFAAENCEDDDFGQLRHDLITLMYLTIDRTQEIQSCLDWLCTEARKPTIVPACLNV
jgi:hypothetical protein